MTLEQLHLKILKLLIDAPTSEDNPKGILVDIEKMFDSDTQIHKELSALLENNLIEYDNYNVRIRPHNVVMYLIDAQEFQCCYGYRITNKGRKQYEDFCNNLLAEKKLIALQERSTLASETSAQSAEEANSIAKNSNIIAERSNKIAKHANKVSIISMLIAIIAIIVTIVIAVVKFK